MTVGSNNPFPSVLLVEQGSAPANPASGQQRAYIKTSDHLLYVVNSSGTVTAVGGLVNPMTTKGDVILGDTGGTPTRLGAGTSAFVLTSNGAAAFPSWQAAAGGSLTTAYAAASAVVTLATPNTLTDSTGAAISCVAGTWLLTATIVIRCGGTAGYAYAEIRDGSNGHVAGGRGGIDNANFSYSTIPIICQVTPGSTTTYKLSGQTGNATDTIERYANGTVITTQIFGLKIA